MIPVNRSSDQMLLNTNVRTILLPKNLRQIEKTVNREYMGRERKYIE